MGLKNIISIKKKNKKGLSVFFIFMIGITFFLLGLALSKPLSDVLTESMLQLDCHSDYLTNSTISNQNKGYCTTIDSFLPLFIGVVFGLGAITISYLRQ